MEVQGTARRGLELFKSTRHIVLYYEDIVSNRTVSSQTLNTDIFISTT